MKAIICTKYGSPDVLKIQEVENPFPKENEMLVRIIATAVNSGDCRVRGLAVKGLMKLIMRFVLGFSKPRKPILGTVFSGIIDSTGYKVTRYNTGDKVFGMTGFSFGTYAEYIALKETGNIAFLPENANFEEAVSLIFGGQTAFCFLHKAKIAEKKNPKVLIIGATGSVGIAAIQIAQYYGADITAVCSREGRDLTESLGVSKIILYDKEDINNLEESFDIIFDAVGKESKKRCKKLLKKDGIYKTVAGLEVAGETQEQLEFLKKLYEEGKMKAVIDKTYSLDEIVAAHTYVDSGRKKGNVIIKVTDWV